LGLHFLRAAVLRRALTVAAAEEQQQGMVPVQKDVAKTRSPSPLQPSPLNPNKPSRSEVASQLPPRAGKVGSRGVGHREPNSPVTPNSPASPLDRLKGEWSPLPKRSTGTAPRTSAFVQSSLTGIRTSSLRETPLPHVVPVQKLGDVKTMSREELEAMVLQLHQQAAGPTLSRPTPVHTVGVNSPSSRAHCASAIVKVGEVVRVKKGSSVSISGSSPRSVGGSPRSAGGPRKSPQVGRANRGTPRSPYSAGKSPLTPRSPHSPTVFGPEPLSPRSPPASPTSGHSIRSPRSPRSPYSPSSPGSGRLPYSPGGPTRNLHTTCCGYECGGDCSNKWVAKAVIEAVNSRKVQSMVKRHPYWVAAFILSYFLLLSMATYYVLKTYWFVSSQAGDGAVQVIRTLRGGKG